MPHPIACRPASAPSFTQPALRMLAGVSMLCLAAAAHAQDAPVPPPAAGQDAARAGADAQAQQEGTRAGDEIVVSARRRDEALQNVPLVANVVTQEQVQKLNFRSLQDVQNIVPGLLLATQPNGTGGNVSLRGVNFDVNASGSNPTVAFYYNDAPIDSGLVLQSLFDIGQIEVLRGPQGTLRGRSSPSGSITITTRRPDLYEAGGNVEVTANDIGTQNINGGVGIPILKGIAAIRVAGVYNEDDGDRVSTINGSVDKRRPFSETKAGRISLRVEPVDWLHLEGSYQRLDRNARQYAQYASFSEVNPAAAASPIFLSVKDRKSIQSAPQTVSQSYNIYNGQAQFSFAGQRLVYVFERGTINLHTYSPQDAANAFPNISFGQNLHTRSTTTSHEARLQNDERVLGIFDYVVGGLDLKTGTPNDLTQATVVALPPFLGGGIATIVQTPIATRGTTHEQSGYGNLTAHLGDKIELDGGLRYIHYDSNGKLIVAGTTIPNPSVDDNHVIYTASAKYEITPDVMVYANTGSSYRPAVFAIGDFSAVQSALEQSFLSLPPETSRSYEIGFKSSLFDHRVRLNATVYHQDFKNYPYRAPGNGVYYINNSATVGANGAVTITPTVGNFNFVGAVPVHVNGVEGEAAFSASDRWDIGLVASYSLGKIKKGTIPCTDLNGDGVPDVLTSAPTLAQLRAAVGANNLSACRVTQRSSFSPPFSATLTSEYRVPLSDRVDGYLRGLLTFNGRSQSDPTNPFDDVNKYVLLNLYAGIRDPKGQWELTLFAKNVTDTEKALTRTLPTNTSFQQLAPPTFRTTVGVTSTSTYSIVTETPPREVGVSLRFNFGSH